MKKENLLAAQPTDSPGAVDDFKPITFGVEDRQFGAVTDRVVAVRLVQRTIADDRFARDDDRRLDFEPVVSGPSEAHGQQGGG